MNHEGQPAEVRKKSRRSRAGFQISTLGFLMALIAIGLLFTLIWLGAGLYLVQRSRQSVQAAESLRAQTIAQLAIYSADMITLSARVAQVSEECKTVVGTLRQQDDTRVQEGSVLKNDLQRFSTWVDTEQARIARSMVELQARIDDLGQRVARQDQVVDQWRTQLLGEFSAFTNTLTRTPPPVSVETRSGGGDKTASPTPARVSLTLPSGDRYEGGLRDGLFEGEGICWYANGNKYVGQFRLGRKQGAGTFTFANGDVYAGEFVNDARHGKGIYTYRDGSRYEGEFVNGSRSGRGRYTFKNGGEYVGEFRDGKKNGRGTHVFPDGTTMEGYWKDDRFIGPNP